MTDSSVTESITQSTFSTIDMSKGKQINISSGQSLTHSKDKTSHRTTGTIKTDTIAQSPLFTLDMSKATQTHYSSGQSFTSLWNKTSTTESSISTIFTSAAHKTVRKTGFTNDQRNNGDKSTSIGQSKGIFKGTNKYVKEDTNEANFSNTIYQDSYNTDRTSAMPTSNQTYGLGGASISVYAVVNKLKKLENTAETYTDAAYGEYDHLHDIQNRRNCPQEKLYYSHGALRNEEDQTYDSSDFGNGKFNEGNALYDHSFSVVEGDYMSNENHDSHNSNNADIYDKAS
ncbi:unnamed protein product [Mytilus coruscus]|uniref:Uncharacterized protein n=1 Tax=Mytilus coruscus TaxID=42192 RepID=A0A6J8EJU1_MYTCO|nr:unnamed protein product [Mytilus coruscus]